MPIFRGAESIAGLKLKPPKCVIVPLCLLNESVKENIGKWLLRNIPEWANFSIQDSTKLLGFYIGPAAGKYNWIEQISKAKARVQVIQTAKITGGIECPYL